jgi:hypothetical protein
VTEVTETAGTSATAGTAGGGIGPVTAPVTPFEGTPAQYFRTLTETTRTRREECLGIRADADTLGSQIVSASYVVDAEVTRREKEFGASIAAGHVRFDAELAATCLQRITTQSCEDFRRDVALIRDCSSSAMVGLVPRGGECVAYADCADAEDFCDAQTLPAHCAPRASVGEGCASRPCTSDARCPAQAIDLDHLDRLKCEPAPKAAEGSPCSITPDCVEGSFCTGHNVCRAYRTSLSCQDNADCPYEQPCLLAPTEATGHCGPGRAQGERCRQDPLFQSDCAFPLDCRSGADGQLTCTNAWVGLGEHCRNTGGNGGVVCIDGNCDIKVEDRATQEGVCVPLGRIGDACYLGSCLPGLECTASGCQTTAP